ncbi:MAG: hypothetical protein WCS31_15790 [Verrucomicrobiae bacterium]
MPAKERAKKAGQAEDARRVEQYGKFDHLQWFLFVAEHSPTPQRRFAAAEKNCRFLGGIASAKIFRNLCRRKRPIGAFQSGTRLVRMV